MAVRVSEVTFLKASSADLPEIEALIRSDGGAYVVDNPVGITGNLVDKRQFNIGRDEFGEIVVMGGWEVSSFSAYRAGKVGREVLLQIQREVITRFRCRELHYGTAMAAHNQLEAHLIGGGSLLGSVAAMFGEGRASGIIARNLGKTMNTDWFAADVTPGLPRFMAMCIAYAAAHRPGETVQFACFDHSKLPEIAGVGVNMMEDGYALKGAVAVSEVLRNLTEAQKNDLFDLAIYDARALIQYNLMKSSDDQGLTLYGSYSNLVA